MYSLLHWSRAGQDEAAARSASTEQIRMRRNGILAANWYDYPQYYDIAFQTYTWAQADFIEAACRKYCSFDARRLLEPACGSGRLVTELAARGYQVTGFDISQSALSTFDDGSSGVASTPIPSKPRCPIFASIDRLMLRTAWSI